MERVEEGGWKVEGSAGVSVSKVHVCLNAAEDTETTPRLP